MWASAVFASRETRTIVRQAMIRAKKFFRLYCCCRGFAITRKKKMRATRAGPKMATAAIGALTRVTATTPRLLSGSRNKGSRTAGRICVPVRMSQPAFIKDQVKIRAATARAIRITKR